MSKINNKHTNKPISQPMELAINTAKEGVMLGEGGPFGAVIATVDNTIIAVAHNTVLRDKDPTCHAEMNAIRLAAKKLGTHVLENLILYTTAEPCPMCLAAIYWARISEVIIGVKRTCAAEYGFDDSYFYGELQLESSKRAVSHIFGVMQEECQEVFALWRELNGTLY